MRYFEFVTEIKAVTNIDPNQVEKEDFDDHIGHTKKVGKIKGYEIHTAESNPHIALKYHHFLVKDPESEGFLGELKLGAFQNYWVSEVWFTPEIQGKGLALPLYVFAIKNGYDLVSDREQSKGSQAIWKNLTKVPGIFVYAWDRKYDEFYQWDPDEDLDSEVYYRQEKMDKVEADYKAKWAELNDKFDADEVDQEEYNRQFALLKDQYKKAEEELSQVKKFSDVRLVAIDEKKSVEEGVGSTLAKLGLAGAVAAGGVGAYNAAHDAKYGDKEPEAKVAQAPAQDKQDLTKIEPPKKQDVEKKEASYTPITGNKNEVILAKHAQDQGIKGVELAAFMSQMAHESENFTDMIEDISHERAAKKYGSGKMAKILGNKSRNDAIRFKGRGYIQLTGRWNYEWMEKELGIDLTSSWSAAQKAADPDIAADIAVAYWKKRVQSKVSDFTDVRAVTKKINPGLHGLDAREKRFLKVANNMDIDL